MQKTKKLSCRKKWTLKFTIMYSPFNLKLACSVWYLKIINTFLENDISIEGDQFKVNMGEKKIISNIDIEMYLTLLYDI